MLCGLKAECWACAPGSSEQRRLRGLFFWKQLFSLIRRAFHFLLFLSPEAHVCLVSGRMGTVADLLPAGLEQLLSSLCPAPVMGSVGWDLAKFPVDP